MKTYLFVIALCSCLCLGVLQANAAKPLPVPLLANEICAVLTNHFSSLSLSDCLFGVFNTDQLSGQFGGPSTDSADNSNPPFIILQKLLKDGTYVVNPHKLIDCVTEIQNVESVVPSPGDRPYIDGAWDSANPTWFGNVENIIRSETTPSCATVFSPATP